MLTRWQTHVTGVHLLENQRQSFPSVRTFAGGRDNHERCQQCRFNDGGHDVADKCLALSVNHGYLRIRTCTKKSSPRSSREKPLQRPKSCRKRWTIMLKSTLWKKPWDRKRRIRSRTDHRTTSRNPCPTSQPQRAVPAEFSHRLYDRQGRMAHPGPRRARIGITDVPGMRISAGTVTPATVVPLGTRRNGDVHPITTAVTIDGLHHYQDVPVTEVGKGIQCQGRQLLLTRHHDSTGQQGPSWWSRAEGRDSGSTAQPAASFLSRHETTSRADRSGHPGSSQQARDVVQRIIRYLRLHPHAGVQPQIDLDHPAVMRYVLSTYLRSLQSQFHQQTSGHGRTPRQRLPTRHSLLAQQTRLTRYRVPTWHGRPARQGSLSSYVGSSLANPAQPARRAGPSCMNGPSRPQPPAHADPGGITDLSQDQSAVGPHSVSMSRLMPWYDHTPSDPMPVTHQRPASNQDVSVNS